MFTLTPPRAGRPGAALSTRRARAAIAAAAELFDVLPADITGPGRTEDLIAPRFAVALVLARISGRAWSAVGRHLNRTYRTVMHAVERAEAWEAGDAEFAAAVALIEHEARTA